jgi:hypothetical protein
MDLEKGLFTQRILLARQTHYRLVEGGALDEAGCGDRATASDQTAESGHD